MPLTCEQLYHEYQALTPKKQELVLAFKKAPETNKRDNVKHARRLMEDLKEKIAWLQQMLWPFKEFPQEKLKQQYEFAITSYRELGFFETLSTGQEGLKYIQKDGQIKEYVIPTLEEITKALRQNKEFYQEKFATMENPRVHITPFALSNRRMAEKYSEPMEDKFVEERVEGKVRIPNKNKTKLFGIKNKEPLKLEPLELREDKENVYFSDELDDILYFPEWKKQGDEIVAKEGITKDEAIAQIGGFRVIILEDIPLAPEQGEGKLIEKEIKIKGKNKKVTRQQVEGGKDASEQYHELKELGEEGLVLEDYISYALLYLKENGIVLDDDRKTSYYCCVLGNNTALDNVPGVCWSRVLRRVFLTEYSSGYRGDDCGVRPVVRVKLGIV